MAVKNYMINDKWLDIAKQNIVEVESTDGVIGSVKVNGEEYGGGGGSSDFSTAEVTVINDSANGYNISTPFINTEDEELVYTGTFISSSSTMVLNVILYKGSNMTVITDTTEYADPVPENNVSMSGDVSYDGSSFIVTGDCTITIS